MSRSTVRLASGLAVAAWAGWPGATAAAGPQTCPVTPDATAGPFPANGQGWGRSSSINALALTGVVGMRRPRLVSEFQVMLERNVTIDEALASKPA